MALGCARATRADKGNGLGGGDAAIIEAVAAVGKGDDTDDANGAVVVACPTVRKKRPPRMRCSRL